MMKTAKETLNEHLIDVYKDGYEAIVAAMISFAAAACKEQREICAKELYQWTIDDELDMPSTILNAPQPQLL